MRPRRLCAACSATRRIATTSAPDRERGCGSSFLFHLVNLPVEYELNLLAEGQPLGRIRRLLEKLEVLWGAQFDFDDGGVGGFLEVGIDPPAFVQEERLAAGEPALIGDLPGRFGAASIAIQSQSHTPGSPCRTRTVERGRWNHHWGGGAKGLFATGENGRS